MSGIVAGALVAHPPILLAEVGGVESRRVRATVEAMRALDQQLAPKRADLALVVSPHGPSSMTELPVRQGHHASGDLTRFRAPQVRFEAEVDGALASALVEEGRRAGFALTHSDGGELDHGVVVPLHLLPRTMTAMPCVFLGVSGWPSQRFVDLGRWLHGWLRNRSVLLIASGDLSHRLTPQAPYGFRPEGAMFDRLVVDALRDNQWDRIERADPELVEGAGECGLRPLAIMLGAARAAGVTSQVLSYEGPFGVGYPVVAFAERTAAIDIQEMGKRAIETYLRTRQLVDPAEPIPSQLRAPSAVFVTLRKHGELRGCVGSTRPTAPTAAHEIVRYAVASAVRDPRFDPVRIDEVKDLTIKVQLLEPSESITDLSGLDPQTYGIIVRSGGRQALLLPGIDEINTPEEQIAAACLKAGIDRHAPLSVERFRTQTLE